MCENFALQDTCRDEKDRSRKSPMYMYFDFQASFIDRQKMDMMSNDVRAVPFILNTRDIFKSLDSLDSVYEEARLIGIYFIF